MTMQPLAIRFWLTIFCLSVTFTMVAAGTVALVSIRGDARLEAQNAAQNLALTLDRDINRNLMIYDLSIRGAGDVFMKPGFDKVPKEFQQAALFDSAATAEYLNTMLISDANGDVVTNQGPSPVGKSNIADREYFSIHRRSPDIGLFISRVLKSRYSKGEPILVLSRRLPASDHRFAGIVSGAVRLSYFQDLFSSLHLGPHGVVTLLRTDGHIVARRPLDKDSIDTDYSGAPPFAQYALSATGQYTGNSPIDGVRRLYTFRHIGQLPLIVIVGIAVEDIDSAWYRRAEVLGGVMLGFSAAMILLCVLLRRELMRRIVAEAESAQTAGELAATAAELATIARTDGLTGLANRRAFEADFAKEWRRSLRDGTSLAVLMIDADWFKLYNDRYGHIEGDNVLRLISRSISRCLRRPGDIGARYGGEEFVILLPATDVNGAIIIAEQIRTAVLECAIEHLDSPLARVTVTIGIAATVAHSADIPENLIKYADESLYDGKARGRNRVSGSGSRHQAAPAPSVGIGKYISGPLPDHRHGVSKPDFDDPTAILF